MIPHLSPTPRLSCVPLQYICQRAGTMSLAASCITEEANFLLGSGSVLPISCSWTTLPAAVWLFLDLDLTVDASLQSGPSHCSIHQTPLFHACQEVVSRMGSSISRQNPDNFQGA